MTDSELPINRAELMTWSASCDVTTTPVICPAVRDVICVAEIAPVTCEALRAEICEAATAPDSCDVLIDEIWVAVIEPVIFEASRFPI